MAAVTISSDFGAQKNKVSHCSIYHEVMGPDARILVFWTLSFKPTFSLSSFTFIKRLLSSSSLSAIRVVSSAYLRLLIFLLAILIPACVVGVLASEKTAQKMCTRYCQHVLQRRTKAECVGRGVCPGKAPRVLLRLSLVLLFLSSRSAIPTLCDPMDARSRDCASAWPTQPFQLFVTPWTQEAWTVLLPDPLSHSDSLWPHGHKKRGLCFCLTSCRPELPTTFSLESQFWLLYPDTELNLGDGFRWSRKEWPYCFDRQRGPQCANALKPVCPKLETWRSFIVVIQRGHDHLMDILLMGWWWGK